MNVELMYFDGCPNRQSVNQRLLALQREFGFDLRKELVVTPDNAKRLGFRGSPTILVNGVDPFPMGNEPVGLACGVYSTPAGLAGSPTDEQLRSAVAR